MNLSKIPFFFPLFSCCGCDGNDDGGGDGGSDGNDDGGSDGGSDGSDDGGGDGGSDGSDDGGGDGGSDGSDDGIVAVVGVYYNVKLLLFTCN